MRKNIHDKRVYLQLKEQMAHRIAKKQHQVRQNQSYQPEAQTTSYKPVQQTVGNNQKNQSKIPRPLLSSTDKIYTHDKYSYRQHKLAFPQAQSLFISSNNYDAGPEFLRPTSALTFGIPKKSSFPLGVWISPFGSEKVHKVRVNSPLRCARCKAYVNGYFRFDGTKTNAVCNICGINFSIDHATVDQNNLNSAQVATEGVMDFVVKDKLFIKKRTDIIKILIVIEISSYMIQSGAFSTIIESVKAAIENSQFEKNVRVGVIIFNGEGLTYLKLSKSENWNEKMPQKFTVKFFNQGLCYPLSDKQFLFDPNNDKQKIIYLLDCTSKIAEDQYKNSKYMTQGANYAAALKSIVQGFQNQVGRVMLFSHSAPRSGALALRPRNQQDNKVPLKPLTPDYFQLSKELVKSRVGVDMFIIAKQILASQQLATTHYIASHTGGSIHLYSPYTSQNHSQNLYYNVYGSLTRKYVYDVNFTARFSNGLNVVSFGIGDGLHQTRDITLGMMDPCSSVTINFQHEEKIQENASAFVQFAIMFTNGDGQRIIRIINYRYLITNKVQVIHQASDYLAVANILMRQVAHKALRGDMRARQQLVNRLIGIVTEYVQQGGNRLKMSNFMEHPNLSPAFAYIHSFINSKVFLNHLKVPADYQVCENLKVTTSNFIGFANTFYPKLFPLTMDIYENTPTPGDIIEGQGDIEQSVVLPNTLPLSAQSLNKQGVFLNWAFDYLLIIIQPQAPSELLIQLFGTDNWDELQEMNSLPQLQSSHNIRLRRRTSKYYGIFLPLLVRTCKKKGPFNDLIHQVLKQDYQQLRYYSFLDTIHQHVQLKLK